MIEQRLPTYFLSHGGGPWPWMKESTGLMYEQLEASLKQVRSEVGTIAKAVLMISGHWESEEFLLSSSANPSMEYDYYGFPEHTYQIRYDAPGYPALAAKVETMLRENGLPTGLDSKRGFDHGSFVLMHEIYPEATLPVVQLSIKKDFDPGEHLKVGELLAPLRDEGVLIIGSGLSFHDLRALRSGQGASPSATFDQWLNDTLVESTSDERQKRLLDWSTAPAARGAHPREDHLIPLMMAVGAANTETGTRIYHQSDFMSAITVSSYRFGNPVT